MRAAHKTWLEEQGFNEEQVALLLWRQKACVNHHNVRTYDHLHDLRKALSKGGGKLLNQPTVAQIDHLHKKQSRFLNAAARCVDEEIAAAGGAAATKQEQRFADWREANVRCCCDDPSKCMAARKAVRALTGEPLQDDYTCHGCIIPALT